MTHAEGRSVAAGVAKGARAPLATGSLRREARCLQRGLLAGALALVSWQAGAAAREVRIFQVHFRPVRDAAALIEPLLSPDGTVLLQPKLNTMTVQDDPEVLRRVAELVATWDVPPLSYRIRVRVMLATTAPPTPGAASPLIEGIGSELSALFHFTAYQEVDTLAITASDGNSVEASAGGRYHLRFTLRAVPQDPERVQLAQLEVARRERAKDDTETLRPLLHTTVSLRIGQTAILGAARSEGASQALILVFWAEREAGR